MSTINNPTIDNSTGDTLTTTVTQKRNIHFGIMIIATEQKVDISLLQFFAFLSVELPQIEIDINLSGKMKIPFCQRIERM